MPIPTSDLQKQVKAPNVSQGKAIDFSAQAAAPILNIQKEIDATGNLLEKGISLAILQSQDARRRASDDAAKQAFNDYEVAKDDLNTQLQSLEGQDAVNFYYGDYTKKINEAHQRLTAVLDSLPDKDIARNYREKVNQINMQNRGFSFLAAKKQENVVRDADHKAFIQNISLEHVNDMVTAPEGVDRYSYAANNAYRDINRANTEYLASKGLATPDMIKAVNQEAMTKFAGEMVRNVANAANWDGAQTGAVYQNEILPAVKSLERYISPDIYQALLKQYAGEAISTDVALRPNDFVGEDGQINKDFINRNYYGLTPWEKTKIISSVQSALSKGHNSSLSQEEKEDLDDYQRKKLQVFSALMSDIGLTTNSDYRIMQMQQGLSKEELSDLRKENIKNFKLDKALNTWVQIEEMLNNDVTLPSGKKVAWDDSKLKDMRDDLRNFITLYVQKYKEELRERPGMWGSIADAVVGQDVTVQEAALHELIQSQQERNGYQGTQLEAVGLADSLFKMSQAMSMDKSINWNAKADSREGFRNPVIRDRIKQYALYSTEAGTSIDVFSNGFIQNIDAIINRTYEQLNDYQRAYLQFEKRLDFQMQSIVGADRGLTPYNIANFDIKSLGMPVDTKTLSAISANRNVNEAEMFLDPIKKQQAENWLWQTRNKFFNDLEERQTKLYDLQNKAIENYNKTFDTSVLEGNK